jgi:L-ascorbate metabolism protein UlaG (beta-lactamase superfamily)
MTLQRWAQGAHFCGAAPLAPRPHNRAAAAIAADWLGVSRVIPVHYAPGDPAPGELVREIAARGSVIEVIGWSSVRPGRSDP